MTEIPNDQHITYQLQYRKCGKPTCSTCKNGQGHGPYYYAYWHEGKRARSAYLGKTMPVSAADTGVKDTVAKEVHPRIYVELPVFMHRKSQETGGDAA